MEKKLSFLGRMKAKRQERKNKQLAAAYKRGYEYGAGRLLSEGMNAEHELCAQAETSTTFDESKVHQQFDLGVLAAVRDFTRLLQNPAGYECMKPPYVKRVRKPEGT